MDGNTSPYGTSSIYGPSSAILVPVTANTKPIEGYYPIDEDTDIMSTTWSSHVNGKSVEFDYYPEIDRFTDLKWLDRAANDPIELSDDDDDLTKSEKDFRDHCRRKLCFDLCASDADSDSEATEELWTESQEFRWSSDVETMSIESDDNKKYSYEKICVDLTKEDDKDKL